MDSEFKDFIVKVDSPPGAIAFMIESVITRKLLQLFPYIKRVDLAVDEWSTVMGNFKNKIGRHFPETLCYVSFGFGLKNSLRQGTIEQNPIGPVKPVVPQQTHVDKEPSVPGRVVGKFAAESDRRIAQLLFDNRAKFPKSALKFKSDLRKPEFYKDICNLENCPRHDKVSRIFDLYQKLNKDAM